MLVCSLVKIRKWSLYGIRSLNVCVDPPHAAGRPYVLTSLQKVATPVSKFTETEPLSNFVTSL